MTIERIQSDHYRIPLPVVLSDSTHKEITHFELITARVTTIDGVEGLGYTYTVGRGGAAVHALIDREITEILQGADEGRIEECWRAMWWDLHWVGRGGAAAFAISAVDIALWDILGKRSGQPLWRLLGGNNPTVAVYAGGIDAVGGELLANLLGHVHPYGNVAAIGLAGSPKLPTMVLPFILRGVSILGIHSVETPRPLREQVWAQLAGDWKPKGLAETVTRTLTLAEVPGYCEELIAGTVTGRALVQLREDAQR